MDGQAIFQRMYICFASIKQGWSQGCRKVIGLDGCFLKGISTGQLLSAVGRDANNQVYPIAWAVVDVETMNNWSWFVHLLKDDLSLNNGDGVAITSDQHKGLIESVRSILPNAEHRNCARHVYSNFSKRWPGVQFRHLFWEAAKCTYVEKFDSIMQKLKDINEEAYHHLADKRPATWSRAFYREGFDCDVVEIGICECWNSMIKDARKKPIIRMLEEIRMKVMVRLMDQRTSADKWSSEICANGSMCTLFMNFVCVL
ncbi:uncharacterized protein [Rutidosis leptorrhynchoides]|uniref:uncharacterized protein n=1 Tax=Rutidosis leptorrhynchoides TaxID=125765 RepID=UPI003A9A606C